jgi:putative addiction module CopG family antidote
VEIYFLMRANMNISLTKDLEEYVAGQLETGHYASASEVIREALRNQIKSSVNSQLLDERIALGRQQVKEGSDTKFVQRVTGLNSEQIDQLAKEHTKPSAH